MFCVLSIGGKQYTISKGDVLEVQKIEGKVGDTLTFNEVLLLGDEQGGEVRIGTPTVSGARVEAVILEQDRAAKVNVIKYKRKVRYRRKIGHRQWFTKVKIVRIIA